MKDPLSRGLNGKQAHCGASRNRRGADMQATAAWISDTLEFLRCSHGVFTLGGLEILDFGVGQLERSEETV